MKQGTLVWSFNSSIFRPKADFKDLFKDFEDLFKVKLDFNTRFLQEYFVKTGIDSQRSKMCLLTLKMCL